MQEYPGTHLPRSMKAIKRSQGNIITIRLKDVLPWHRMKPLGVNPGQEVRLACQTTPAPSPQIKLGSRNRHRAFIVLVIEVALSIIKRDKEGQDEEEEKEREEDILTMFVKPLQNSDSIIKSTEFADLSIDVEYHKISNDDEEDNEHKIMKKAELEDETTVFGESTTANIECLEPKCKEQFKTNLEHGKHLKDVHKICYIENRSVSFLQNDKLKCPECPNVFNDKPSVKYHLRNTHDERKTTCDQCGQKFTERSILNHILRAHSEDTFNCEKCDYTTHVLANLKYHIVTSHDAAYNMCEECGKSFKHKNILSMHIKDKHSGKILNCDQCDFTCKGQTTQLSQHKYTRHWTAQIICIYCNFLTSSKSEMEDHKTTHQGDQISTLSCTKSDARKRKEKEAQMDLICHLCNVKKKSKASLRLHKSSIHDGVRYKCLEDGCKFSGRQKGQLTVHIESVHLQIKYQCDVCDFEASQKYALRLHRIKSHDIQPFACDQCTFRCQHFERMQRHMLIMHS